MPIKILDRPEPLSRASYSEECLLIESHASRVLTEDLRRYCLRRIAGRSFLISGHRGAGKTTLVASAFQQVHRQALGDPRMLRPLLVQLNGPSLLPDPPAVTRASEGSLPWDTSAARAAAPSHGEPRSATTQEQEQRIGQENATARDLRSETQCALEQITLCLYRALARDAARAFRTRVRQRIGSKWQAMQALEVAAELELELPQCPEPARLRELWRHAGLLQVGVWRNFTQSHDQAFRELVALSAAADAYRRISGTLKQEDVAKEGADDKLEATHGLALAGKDLFNSLIALLSGALAGTGFLASQAGRVPSLLAGVATALAASLVLKVSRTRSRSRSRTREYSFLPDTTVATLDRVLPMLIDWLLDAGIAPIFLVDELDKVDELQKRIVGLVRHLKQLVAERAFFCFLTDRSYFEQVKQTWMQAAYPIEYTYFTHQLYVTFSPGDFHQYLDELLQPPEAPAQPTAALDATPASTVQSDLAASIVGAAIAEDAADYLVLPYILLYRSKMHPLDLRRVLAQLSSDDTIDLPPGRVRSFNFCLELLMQVAFEMIVDEATFAASIEQNPAFYRLVVDALYYPARKWDANENLDLSEAGRREFRQYLVGRMGLDPRLQGAVKRIEHGRKVLKKESARSMSEPCNADDFTLLWSGVASIVSWLSDPGLFFVSLRSWDFGADPERLNKTVREALERALSSGPLLTRIGNSKVYRWRFEPSGLERSSREVPTTSTAAAPTASAVPSSGRGSAAEASLAVIGDAGRQDEPAGSATTREGHSAAMTAPAFGAEDWKPDVDFIDAVASTLADICAVSLTDASQARGLVDFSTLSTRLHILSTSPAWPEAQRATARLRRAYEDHRDYPEAALDVKCLRDFAGQLAFRGEILARALVCGSLVGRASKLDNQGERLLLGLRAIADTFDFSRLGQERIAATFENIALEIHEDFEHPLAKLLFLPPPPALSDDVNPWRAWIQRRIDAINSAELFPQSDLLARRDKVWEMWRHRLDGFFDNRDVLGPRFNDVVCRAAGIGPGKLLDWNLDQMTISSWTAAALCALADLGPDDPVAAPVWLAGSALATLGFGWISAFKTMLPAGKLEQLGATPVPYRAPPILPELRVLLVKQSQASVADSWRPSPLAAVFAPTPELMLRRDRGWPDWQVWVSALAFQRVVVEQPASAPTGAAQPAPQAPTPSAADDLEKQLRRQTRREIVPLYAQPPATPRPGQVVAPKSVQELIDILRFSGAPGPEA